MAIENEIKKDFLDTLKVSPAWSEFLDGMVDGMDSILMTSEPICQGLTEVTVLDQRNVTSGSYIGINSIIVYRLDTDQADLQGNGCLLSLDGTTFTSRLIVGSKFYIKFIDNRTGIADFSLKQLNFVNKSIKGSDFSDILYTYGVESSSSLMFSRLKSASPISLKDALDKAGISHTIEYFYTKQVGSVETVSIGTRERSVRSAIFIEEIDGLYRYKSKIEIQPLFDFISYKGIFYKVVSRNLDNIGLEAISSDLLHLAVRNSGVIKFVQTQAGKPIMVRKTGMREATAVRTNYIVPLSEDNLTNVISLEVEVFDLLNKANDILNRVKPARAVDRLRSKATVSILDKLTLTDNQILG